MQVVAAIKITLSPLILRGNDRENYPSTCTEHLNVAVQNLLSMNINILPQCGERIIILLWYQVAFLKMTDPSQQCPSACLEGVH